MPDNDIVRSVEILNQTSVKGDNAETVFDGYRKGGCHSGGGEAPENVSKRGCILQSPFFNW